MPMATQGKKKRSPVPKERLERIQRIREELSADQYRTQEKLEAIFEDLVRDVNKRTRS